MRLSAKIFSALFLLLLSLPARTSAGELKDSLRCDVEFLSDSLCAGRATGTRGAVEAAAYIARRLGSMGYSPVSHSFAVDSSRTGHNILSATLPPKGKAVTVVMAYYDGLGTLNGRLYPGADSNASGVAALLALASRLRGRDDVLLAFVDAHNAGRAGAADLRNMLKGKRISLVINLDILGATLSPVDDYWPDYLMALGGERFRGSFERCNAGIQLHLYYQYYRSRNFTDMFYRRVGDQSVFLADGVPAVLFTSGITSNTNKPGDGFDTLDYDIFAKRVEFIARFIRGYGRK